MYGLEAQVEQARRNLANKQAEYELEEARLKYQNDFELYIHHLPMEFHLHKRH